MVIANLIGLLTLYLRRSDRRPYMYYIHNLIRRIIRLKLPVLCFLAGIIILPLLVDGPHWKTVDTEAKFIERNWWTFYFQIENYYNYQFRFSAHLWFLSILLQLTVVTAPILFIQDRWPRTGMIIMSVLITAGGVAHIADVAIKRHYFLFGYSFNMKKHLSYFHNNYQRPYFAHLASYCSGLLIGYILSKKKEVKFSKGLQVIFWICSVALMGIAAFGISYYVTALSVDEILPILHRCFAPLLWTIGIAWVCVACMTGYGGVVNWFLSLKIFVVLDRLDIWIYLFHPLVILYVYGSLRKAMVFMELSLTSLAEEVYQVASHGQEVQSYTCSYVYRMQFLSMLPTPATNFQQFVRDITALCPGPGCQDLQLRMIGVRVDQDPLPDKPYSDIRMPESDEEEWQEDDDRPTSDATNTFVVDPKDLAEAGISDLTAS
ncbi:nose resistant to fluoxetine protein 6-like [Centruroides vittatus]|uniref:nose resistant to fluoxetine protein 6-like n=1 Tax=Centruroides vittatus TaxID=120091 RepID=UPI00350F43D9